MAESKRIKIKRGDLKLPQPPGAEHHYRCAAHGDGWTCTNKKDWRTPLKKGALDNLMRSGGWGNVGETWFCPKHMQLTTTRTPPSDYHYTCVGRDNEGRSPCPESQYVSSRDRTDTQADNFMTQRGWSRNLNGDWLCPTHAARRPMTIHTYRCGHANALASACQQTHTVEIIVGGARAADEIARQAGWLVTENPHSGERWIRCLRHRYDLP